MQPLQPPQPPAPSGVEVFRALSQLARQLLAPARDPTPTFELVVCQAASTLQGDAASLYLAAPEGDYELVAVHGRPFERRRIPKDQGVVGEVARCRRVVAIEEIRGDPRYRSVGRAHREGFVSMVAAPLVVNHELLGVLGVYWTARRVLSDAELELVQLFADYAAAAVALARLVAELDAANRKLKEAHDRIAEAARRDPLTGVYNRAVFWAALARLTGETAEAGSIPVEGVPAPSAPAVVLMIDLNGFKELNDAHGHLVGDAVLQEVGALLQGFCGTDGIVARYGGDEFGMLLSLEEPSPERLVNSVRQAVADHTFAGGFRIDLPSVGYAVYPDEAQTARLLVALADARMYRQKMPRSQGRPGQGSTRGTLLVE